VLLRKNEDRAITTYMSRDPLVTNLRLLLGPEYDIHYPVMPHEDDADYEIWKVQIASALTAMTDPVLLLGHSVGASILLKYLSEIEVERTIAGTFLIATPFWGGDGWRYEGFTRLALQEGFATELPEGAPIFLYHSRDDEIVPFTHLGLYAQSIPQATIRELNGRRHQLNNDLSEVAEDIRGLQR
jgi:predicted alpha/beta hydrolase family esterase